MKESCWKLTNSVGISKSGKHMERKKLIILLVCMLLSFSACAQGQPDNRKENETMMVQKLYLTIGENKVSATLAANSSAQALVERLKKGNVTYSAHDYGGFEKVGDLGFELPTNDRQMTSQSGDIFLYVGSSLVIFYGSNSWSYTKIGTLDNMSQEEVKAFLLGGKGNVTITLSLE